MTSYRHRVRCIEAHSVIIPADKMIDQHGNVLCEVPSREIYYPYGHESGFRTKSARDVFLKANPDKWEAASV